MRSMPSKKASSKNGHRRNGAFSSRTLRPAKTDAASGSGDAADLHSRTATARLMATALPIHERHSHAIRQSRLHRPEGLAHLPGHDDLWLVAVAAMGAGRGS